MTPALRRLRLLRDLDEALAAAFCRWPGKPPVWLVDVSAVVESRLDRLERRLERPPPRPSCLPPAGARP